MINSKLLALMAAIILEEHKIQIRNLFYQILHSQDGETPIVLLVRHPPRFLQHALRRRRTLQPTGLVKRVSL